MAQHDPQVQASYANRVIQQMHQLGGLMEDLKALQAARAELPVAAYNLLSCVAGFSDQGCTVSQAAEILGVRPQALNTPAARLANDGLLLRQVDSSDSRARRLIITQAGEDRLQVGQNRLNELAGIIVKQVPAANVAHLILSRLVGALNEVIKAEKAGSGP